MVKHSAIPTKILQRLADGQALKSHRFLDGNKEFRLHALDGAVETVRKENVALLRREGLIDSNKKFPVATFWLTKEGKAMVDRLRDGPAGSKETR